jgi:hypothetical protein
MMSLSLEMLFFNAGFLLSWRKREYNVRPGEIDPSAASGDLDRYEFRGFSAITSVFVFLLAAEHMYLFHGH